MLLLNKHLLIKLTLYYNKYKYNIKKREKCFTSPFFISKFFDNQSVSSNYHEYLKSYIAISGINQALEQKEESSTPRKMKI